MGTLRGAGPPVAVLLCLLAAYAVGEEVGGVATPVAVNATAAPVSEPTLSLDVITLLYELPL